MIIFDERKRLVYFRGMINRKKGKVEVKLTDVFNSFTALILMSPLASITAFRTVASFASLPVRFTTSLNRLAPVTVVLGIVLLVLVELGLVELILEILT